MGEFQQLQKKEALCLVAMSEVESTKMKKLWYEKAKALKAKYTKMTLKSAQGKKEIAL